MKFDAFGTSKHGKGKSLSKKLFAVLISTLGRFDRANKKKNCHIHFKMADNYRDSNAIPILDYLLIK